MAKPSYVSGSAETALVGETIGAHLERIAAAHPKREALVVRHQGVRWTWSELDRRVDALAAGLVDLGLEPGDRIGLWSPNCAEWVLTQLATAKAGLVLTTINPAYRAAELEYALRKSGCRALILARRFKGSDYVDMVRQVAPQSASCPPGALHEERLPELRSLISIGAEQVEGMIAFDDLARAPSVAAKEKLGSLTARLQFDDPINLQFTSGTTGAPKAVTLTHHNLLNNGLIGARGMRFSAEDRLCIPVPLYHCFGMVMSTLACLTHAATMVFPGEAFDATAVLEAVQAERCTALHGVPTMFIAELEHPQFDQFDLSSLRTGIMGGAPCPVEVLRRVAHRMNMREITIGYGMTETSPITFQSALAEPLENRITSVGHVLPHTEAKIVDAAGRVVPRGATGELLIRGYCVMRGYWEDDAGTAQTIDHAGWLRTGDLATLDDEGRCNIVGRIKDMVIRGGENIYPREVEEFLYRHPDIEAVQVFGVPDSRFGEELCAWVRLRAGRVASATDLQEFCRGRIAHYKIPRYLRFVTEFPMTVPGNPQK